MKVYLGTTGHYSDYHIVAVFLDRELALQAQAIGMFRDIDEREVCDRVSAESVYLIRYAPGSWLTDGLEIEYWEPDIETDIPYWPDVYRDEEWGGVPCVMTRIRAADLAAAHAQVHAMLPVLAQWQTGQK